MVYIGIIGICWGFVRRMEKNTERDYRGHIIEFRVLGFKF